MSASLPSPPPPMTCHFRLGRGLHSLRAAPPKPLVIPVQCSSKGAYSSPTQVQERLHAHVPHPHSSRTAVPAGSAALALAAATLGGVGAASAHGSPGAGKSAVAAHALHDEADGSSGLTVGGAGIPNIDSVKKTIYAYYGDPRQRHGEPDGLAVHP